MKRGAGKKNRPSGSVSGPSSKKTVSDESTFPPKADLFSSGQVQEMIRNALENQLSQLETLKLLTS